jgi:hypothetical protein
MKYIPTDEILDALAPEIGIIAFHLGIELGLCAVDLERTWYRCYGNYCDALMNGTYR